jgi:hypothetical protein
MPFGLVRMLERNLFYADVSCDHLHDPVAALPVGLDVLRCSPTASQLSLVPERISFIARGETRCIKPFGPLPTRSLAQAFRRPRVP